MEGLINGARFPRGLDVMVLGFLDVYIFGEYYQG